MTTRYRRAALASAMLGSLSGAFVVAPTPAIAQATRTGEIIVFGNDPCPRSTDDQIVVCRRMKEEDRFRIPPKLRPSGPPQVGNSWVNKSKALASQGATGPMSCSAVGPAGYTGCALQEINRARAESRENTAADTPPQ